jgi:tetratricopeptide (TPR) repeat protein
MSKELLPFDEIQKTSKKAALGTAIGAILILIAFLLGVWQLSDLNKQITMKKAEENALKADLEKTKTQLRREREADISLRLAIIKYHSKDYSAAVTYYNKAIKLDPLNPVAYDLKGYALLRNGEPEKAVESLKRSVEIDDSYIFGHYNLALAYWASGNQEKAISEVKKVIVLNPDFVEIIKKDSQFNKFKASKDFIALITKQ